MFHVYVCIRFTRNTGVCRYRENFHCLLYHVRHSFLCIFVDVVVALVSSFIFRSGSSVSLFVFVLNICFFFFSFCSLVPFCKPIYTQRKRAKKRAQGSWVAFRLENTVGRAVVCYHLMYILVLCYCCWCYANLDCSTASAFSSLFFFYFFSCTYILCIIFYSLIFTLGMFHSVLLWLLSIYLFSLFFLS